MTDDKSASKPRRDSLLRSVLSNWVGHFVFMVSGFVLPRLIGDRVGQDALGVWDLGWSLVAYSHLLVMGIGGAVNRYVARYRAGEDWQALNSTVNSSLAILTVSFVLAVAAAGVFASLVPVLLRSAESVDMAVARRMVLLLGIAAALKMPSAVFDGVLGGFGRFDLKNAVRVSIALGLLGVLTGLILSGRDLVALAWAVLGAELLRIALCWLVARRVFPVLRLGPRLASWSRVRELLRFGSKSVLQDLSRAGLYQTNGLILAYFAGPAALAVYARQRALVMHATRFLNQYAHVLIPASSALDADRRDDELRALLIKSTKYALFIALPIVALLAILGGPLVRLWMGSEYAAPKVLALLALGHLAPLAQRPAFCILTGMHRHAIPAVAEAIAAVVSVALGLVFVGLLGWGMMGAALAMIVPLTAAGGIVVLVHACRSLELSIGQHIRGVLPGPLAVVIPFVAVLMLAAWLGEDSSWAPLAFGVGIGGALLVVEYWCWVLPAGPKSQVCRALGLVRAHNPHTPIRRKPAMLLANPPIGQGEAE